MNGRILVLLVATFLLVGSYAFAQQPVVLRVFSYMDAVGVERFQPMIEEFQERYPHIRIVHETVAGSGAALYPDALRTALLSGDPPDVFLMWGGTIAEPYMRADQVRDLKEYYDKYNWHERFIPWAVEATQYQGATYGVPMLVRGIGYWYRTDIFERYGLTVPTSYQEMEQLAARLRNQNIHALSLGGRFGWHTMRFLEYLLEHTAGPELHDALNRLEARWDDPAVVKAYELLAKWVENQWLVPNFLNVVPADARWPVYRGNAAMIPEGPWFEGTLIADEQHGPYDFFIPPTDHTPLRYSAFIEQFMIPKASRHPDEAALFLDFVSAPETLRKYPLVFSTPATIGVTPDPEELPMSYKFQVTFETARATYTITDQALEKELMDTFFAIQDGIIAGRYTPEEGAREMQAAVERWKAER